MSAAQDIGTPARVWSPLQQAVFDAVEAESPRHLVVEALAGTGKTTTIVEALRHTTEGESVLVAAFNKDIASELQSRNLPRGVEASTLHSYGLRNITRALGDRAEVDGFRVSNAAKQYIGAAWSQREARTATAKLVSRAKAQWWCEEWAGREGATRLDELADDAGIDIPKGTSRAQVCAAAASILTDHAESNPHVIDYDDMIWIPLVQGMSLRRYDWIFVDETQDLNPTQLEMILRAAGDTGRIVAIGDRHQAIYSFRGADRFAIPRMIATLDAKVLPLSVTYRCPKAVVAKAQEFVPALECREGAPEGIVRNCGMAALKAGAAPGDFVISRSNAPLVSLAFWWLARGVRASIRGRDIGAGLAAWIKASGATAVDGPQGLRACVESWYNAESKRLLAADRDIGAITDKADCLCALSEGCETAAQVLARVETLFTDDGTTGILLTSTHRAKGLEADRVWLLRDTYLKWPGQEEENLLYVAITRAKRELVYVTGKDEES